MKAIDLFAGFGGFTLGAELAGVRVVWAANHSQIAVDAHAAAHPHVEHVCQDLRQADWTTLPAFDLLLAGPACQGHSEASQPKRRPYHDAMRATAWAVVDCAEVTRPRAFIVENVPRMARWQLFGLWRAAFERLGYTVATHLVLASHHGVPQRRTRLFVTGVRNGARVEIRPRSTVEPAFGPCIDWTAPGWRPIAKSSPDARARIARAQRAHGPRCLSQHVTNHPGVGLGEPIRTITTKDQWVVVDGDRCRALSTREAARAQSFPDSWALPAVSRLDALRGLGNAVPPELACDVVAATKEAA